MKLKVGVVLAAGMVGALAQQAWALPVFQVYSPGAVGTTIGSDEDTWFQSSNTFQLVVVSSFGPNAVKLEDITLIASVPGGQTGTITVSPISGSSGIAPNRSDLLPTGVAFNNHYPFQDDVSDFVTFDLIPDHINKGTTTSTLHDYNARTGSTGAVQAYGEEHVYQVSVQGDFTSVHFDVYGFETDALGRKVQRSTWDVNPGSHDVTALTVPTFPPNPRDVPPPVPLPAAAWGGMALFGAIGTGRIVKRRRMSEV